MNAHYFNTMVKQKQKKEEGLRAGGREQGEKGRKQGRKKKRQEKFLEKHQSVVKDDLDFQAGKHQSTN